jgi:hypothetical protein
MIEGKGQQILNLAAFSRKPKSAILWVLSALVKDSRPAIQTDNLDWQREKRLLKVVACEQALFELFAGYKSCNRKFTIIQTRL